MGQDAHDTRLDTPPAIVPGDDALDPARWHVRPEHPGAVDDADHLRLILETARLFTWELNLGTQRASYSTNAEAVLGFPFPSRVEEIDRLIHPEDQTYVDEQFAGLSGSEGRFEAEYRLVGPRGQVVWVESRGVWAGDAVGRRVVGVTQNITERKLRELNTAFLVTLDDTIRPLADADAIFREACRLLAEHLEVEQVTYAELEGDGSAVVWPAWSSGEPSVTGRIDASQIDPTAVTRFADGRTYVVTDTHAADLPDGERRLLERARSRSRIAVPLIKGERLRGVLSVHHPDPRHWSSHEIALVEETAERIWGAVERARAEQALRVSEGRYRTLFESIDEGFCVIDVIFDDAGTPIDYRFVEANSAFERQTGLHDAVGRTARELVPGLEAHWFEMYGRVARTGEPVRFVNEAQAMDGRWFDVNAFRFGDADQPLVALLFTDITERHRADAALRASEERLRRAVEIETVGVIFFRIDGPITFVNDAFLRMSGYTREDILAGRVRWSDITPAEWMGPSMDALEQFRAQGRSTPFEKQYVRADGSRWWVLSTTSRISDEEGVQFVIDISELKQAEAERDRLAAIVQQTRDAVVGFDLEGRITDWNPAAEALCGYSAAEAIGQPVGLIVPEARVQGFFDDLAHLRAGRDLPPFESAWTRRDGGQIDLEIQASAMRDALGRIIGVAAVARDATLRKRLERAQDDFLAMVSHDLRSPVTVLSGRAQLMKRRQVYDEAGVETILEQARRIERLIADLQDLVRLEAGGFELRREPVDLAVLLREAVDRAHTATPTHAIALHVPDAPVVGAWDRDRLGQVLDNLIGNAVKYSPPEEEVIVRIAQEAGIARVSVTDRGPGVPPSMLPQLFDRFYRGEKHAGSPGLGLGLYISRMLVEAHGGRIWASSTRGGGSTFSFTLPQEA